MKRTSVFAMALAALALTGTALADTIKLQLKGAY
jgi:hypothetical protein